MNNDPAIAAGRELWGYPKKYADITLTEQYRFIHETASKNGNNFLELKSKTNESGSIVGEPTTTPHFNIRTISKPDGRIFMQEVIECDTSSDFILHKRTFIMLM